jgi:poly(beta-D-mannuronate) lyase
MNERAMRLSSLYRRGQIPVPPSDLANVLATAKPGDTLILADGMYRDTVLNLRGNGERTRPILIRAATPGKVIFTGASAITLEDSVGIVLSSLVFERGTAEPFLLRDTRFCRITECVIRECNADGKRIHWIRIAGARSEGNRVDHCFTSGKRTDGVVLTVEGASGKMPQHNRIDHNHFKDVIKAVNNGMETIRVGTSGFSQLPSHTVVEHNLFENASGDAEIISNKSCDNVYRNNTFLRCEGGVVMRHGHRGQIIGNIFLGAGSKRAAGVRLHGSGHVVRHNYMAGLIQYALSLPCGQSKYIPTGYEPTIDARLENNTIIETAGTALHLGVEKSEVRDTPPKGIVLAGNLIAGGIGPFVRLASPSEVRWIKNRFSLEKGATVGMEPVPSGIEIGDVRLSPDNGLLRPPPGIGADPAVYGRPLTAADVGPPWLRER